MEALISMRDDVKGGALTEVTFLILLSLYRPRHGYAVMQYIEERTGGRLLLGAGTLYGALNALLKKGWIEPFGTGSERKKNYVVTESGKRAAENELGRLKQVVDLASQAMGGKLK
jgi:DNA-binding PadR family transcriptional regulator